MMTFLFGNSWIWLVILAFAVLLIYAMIKYDKLKLLGWMLCVAYIVVGGVGCIRYVMYQNSTSISIGTPEVHDPYENFNFFTYDLSDIVWYENEGKYDYQTEYSTHLDFDGDNNKYHLLLNNELCTKTKSTKGRLTATLLKQFKDLDGQVTATITLNFDFAFYTSKIEIHITTDATSENIGKLKEYVNMNGFTLRLISRIYNSTLEGEV